MPAVLALALVLELQRCVVAMVVAAGPAVLLAWLVLAAASQGQLTRVLLRVCRLHLRSVQALELPA